MDYTFKVDNINYEYVANGYDYSGTVTIDGFKFGAHYIETIVGIPYLHLLGSDYDEDGNFFCKLDVELRLGYPPVFHGGKKNYAEFFADKGMKLMDEFANAAHELKLMYIPAMLADFDRNLNLYLERKMYKLTWKPGQFGDFSYDGYLAIGTDYLFKNPRVRLYFKYDNYTYKDLFFYGHLEWEGEREYNIYDQMLKKDWKDEEKMKCKLEYAVQELASKARWKYDEKIWKKEEREAKKKETQG